jgi:hypothetical protein
LQHSAKVVMLSVAFSLIGITAFSIMTFIVKILSVIMLSMKGVFVTLSITTLLGLTCDAQQRVLC